MTTPNTVNVLKNDARPLPEHKRWEYRRRLGGEVSHLCQRAKIKNLQQLAKTIKLPHALLVTLVAGENTDGHITVEMMNRIALALSCELILHNDEGEKHYGATATLEELFGCGVWPTLQPIN